MANTQAASTTLNDLVNLLTSIREGKHNDGGALTNAIYRITTLTP
jgi:hypothetical protein